MNAPICAYCVSIRFGSRAFRTPEQSLEGMPETRMKNSCHWFPKFGSGVESRAVGLPAGTVRHLKHRVGCAADRARLRLAGAANTGPLHWLSSAHLPPGIELLTGVLVHFLPQMLPSLTSTGSVNSSGGRRGPVPSRCCPCLSYADFGVAPLVRLSFMPEMPVMQVESRRPAARH